MRGGATREAVRRERAWGIARWVFLVASAGLIAFDVIYTDQGDWISHLISVVGAVTLTVGVGVHRPKPQPAWWLTSAAFVLLAAAGVSEHVMISPTSTWSRWTVGLAAVGLLCLAAGLTEFSRRIARSGPTDAIDATMSALATYLLLWTILIGPLLRYDPSATFLAVLLPIGVLLVLTSAARLALAGGWRVPTLTVLLCVSFGVVLAFALELAKGLPRGTLWANEALFVLTDVYSVAVGWLGLHPSLLAGVHRLPVHEVTPSRQRMFLFGALAAVPPAVWLAQEARVASEVGAGVPAIVPPVLSALLLLLLVLRIGMVSRVAVVRADALALAIEEQAELQRELRYQAEHDPLTGLHNRAVLGQAVEAALRSPDPATLALLLLDLDQFKDVNDTLGHPVGDELLIEVAGRLRHFAPFPCTLVRLGGDEFAVLLDGSAARRAVEVSERLIRELRPPYLVRGHELRITASIGILMADPVTPRVTPSDLLRDADQALYAAKAAGKNRARVFSAPNSTHG